MKCLVETLRLLCTCLIRFKSTNGSTFCLIFQNFDAFLVKFFLDLYFAHEYLTSVIKFAKMVFDC